jgi:Uma2 family endonuclease
MKQINDFDELDLTRTYTYADYLTWNFMERVELLWGKVFKMSPAPTTLHQRVLAIIQGYLFQFLKGKHCQAFPAPFDVRFPDDSGMVDDHTRNVVQPDISVICDLNKLDDRGCKGAPDLVIEIISKSTAQKDLHEKYALYEKYGVKEYWVIYPVEKILTIFLLDQTGKYQTRKPLTRGDKARSVVLDGFEINLDEVFEDIFKEPEEDYGEKVRRI